MACIKLNLNVDVNSCLKGLQATLRLRRPKSEIKRLEKEMARLRGKRDDIKNQIDEAERKGKILTNEVSQWLREVEILEGQATDIKQDFQSMSCLSCNCFNRTGDTSRNRTEAFAVNLEDEENSTTGQTQQPEDHVSMRESSNCCSIIQRAAKKLSEANELMSRAGALVQIATVQPPEPVVMLPISHRLPVGIESYVKAIVGYIDGGKENIIGIYGMGGVGKTTVLKSIQQYYLNQSKFDHVIWVVASKDCQLKRLQEEIATRLGLMTLQENDDEKACGDKLFIYLKNKKCLLFLDDIWEQLDLQLLGMAHSATERGQQQPRKVVVFTTRSETVCGQMTTTTKFKVKCLDPDKAWQLFEQNIDGDILKSDGGIKFVAQELAKECAGLPLALITVARAMLGKRSWEVWNDALHQIRDKHEWSTIGLSKDSVVMYKAFKLSYDSLENDSIRECLLCCSLWPEDYEIDKFEELIPCWIGCGIINEFNVINEAFTKGCSHLEALMAASLLEHSSEEYYTEKYVKMHDVIRDMALLMVSELKRSKRKWIVKAGTGLSHLPRQEEWQEAERASFMRNKITSLQEYGASTFPKLSMLILRVNDCLTIPRSLFASMPRLTYLDLSKCRISELPMEIGTLTDLRYLNLSDNLIRTLPVEFGCLSKLEYLLLRDTKLKIVPNGTISNLSMLKWLDIRGVFTIRDWWLNELDIRGMHPMFEWWWDELKCLKGHHQLSVGIDINATTANIERLNMLSNVSIWDLTMDGENISELPNLDLGTPQWCYNISDNLESLTILNVAVDKLMLTARCLKTLHFSELKLLEKVSLNGVGVYNLRALYIYGCWMLKDVSWVLQLPHLNLLVISECPGMKNLISNFGNSNSSSNIRRLSLFFMLNLNCITDQPLHFPYLEYMQVRACPRFKKLPFGAEILKSRLREIHGDQIWWNNLEWDEENNKNSLTPYFIPDSRRRLWRQSGGEGGGGGNGDCHGDDNSLENSEGS